MIREEIFKRIGELAIVPVIAIEDASGALPLADALLQGGLPIVEVTFRTAAAAEVIRKLVQERPSLLIGAGTVLTRGNLEAAKAAGAAFAVAPGLNPETVRASRDLDMPFVPGVATPSEIEQALALGCSTLKFFPSEAMGGLDMLSALGAPYGHTGVKFVPTGGVSPANLEKYLGCKFVAAVGGTWLAKREDLASGNWAEVRSRCKAAVEIVRQVRSASR